MDIQVKQEIKKLLSNKVSCPSNMGGLNEIIKLKNKLTKQLNNLYNQIENINKIIDPINKTLSPAKTGITTAQAIISATSFIPSTVSTPIPVGPIIEAQKVIKTLRNIIGKGESKIGVATSTVNTLISKLQNVIDLLEIVDMVIESCAEELGKEGDIEILIQDQISKDLLASTQDQSNQLSPVVTNLNGFEMSVVTVDELTGSNLKRRQAVARNSNGIVMLRGDKSFSSNDQILIDELVYYIQQNKLKA